MILIDKNNIDLPLRKARQAQLDEGALPAFPADDASLRDAKWRIEPGTGASAAGAALLPGVQSGGEARNWAQRLRQDSQVSGGVVLWVDSLWGAFEIEEILRELKDFVIDVRRADDGFLLSFIEAFQRFPDFVLPDRDDMKETTHFLRSFRRLVESACARRGIAVDGGAAAADEGHRIEAADLLLVPRGRITERGMRLNIEVALAYLARGRDATPGDEALLSAALAGQLAAAQLWQWVRHETGVLDVGRIVTPELFSALLEEELAASGAGEMRRDAAVALSATVLGESFTMHALFDTASGPA